MKKLALLFTLSLFVFGASGCFPTPVNTDPSVYYTQAAKTVQAELTLQSLVHLAGTATAQAGLDTLPTATPQQQEVQPTPTSVPPTATELPTITPLPTATQAPPTATAIPIPCNRAEFVLDVTIPDGTTLPPGAEFLKIWRLKNSGSCIWNSNYRLVFESGDFMGVYEVFSLRSNVLPGESVDISANLVAPNNPGLYRSNWKLRSPDGVIFGLGANADKPFWAEIRVQAYASNPNFRYDFAANVCAATWRTNQGVIPCTGRDDPSSGSVIVLSRPELENGRTENELTLWTLPPDRKEGWIAGAYPPLKIQSGDRFMTDVGCLANSRGCDVTFSLSYRTSDRPAQSLGEWREVFDGRITRVDIDLSNLVGQTVQFILMVSNNGNPSQANAFWLAASVRQGKVDANIPAVLAARLKIAQYLGVDFNQVKVIAVEDAIWRDSCLGVFLPDQICAEVVTPGYRIVLEVAGKQYEAHTNQDGSIIFWFVLNP
jgi:hypothetical protein